MPQLNFNMLATEGPQNVFQGFMQGQQLQIDWRSKSSSVSLGNFSFKTRCANSG